MTLTTSGMTPRIRLVLTVKKAKKGQWTTTEAVVKHQIAGDSGATHTTGTSLGVGMDSSHIAGSRAREANGTEYGVLRPARLSISPSQCRCKFEPAGLSGR